MTKNSPKNASKTRTTIIYCLQIIVNLVNFDNLINSGFLVINKLIKINKYCPYFLEPLHDPPF